MREVKGGEVKEPTGEKKRLREGKNERNRSEVRVMRGLEENKDSEEQRESLGGES